MATEQYQNFALGTTTATISAATNPATIVLQSGQGANFPATTNGPFRITLSTASSTVQEVMLVTTRATDTMTAYRGTLIPAHAAAEIPTPSLSGWGVGSVVSGNLTAGAMNEIRVDIHQQGADNSKTESQQGNIYYPNNGVSLYYDNGTSFNPYGPIYEFGDPNASTNTWSWINQGAATVDTVHGGIGLINTATEAVGATASAHAYVCSAPATPYHAIFGFSALGGGAIQNLLFGPCFSDGTNLSWCGPNPSGNNFGAILHFYIPTANDPGYSGYYNLFTINNGYCNYTPLYWIRLGDNGTNRTYDFGLSPYDWLNVGVETRTRSYTANKVGMVLNGSPAGMRLHTLQFTS